MATKFYINKYKTNLQNWPETMRWSKKEKEGKILMPKTSKINGRKGWIDIKIWILMRHYQ